MESRVSMIHRFFCVFFWYPVSDNVCSVRFNGGCTGFCRRSVENLGQQTQNLEFQITVTCDHLQTLVSAVFIVENYYGYGFKIVQVTISKTVVLTACIITKSNHLRGKDTGDKKIIVS